MTFAKTTAIIAVQEAISIRHRIKKCTKRKMRVSTYNDITSLKYSVLKKELEMYLRKSETNYLCFPFLVVNCWKQKKKKIQSSFFLFRLKENDAKKLRLITGAALQHLQRRTYRLDSYSHIFIRFKQRIFNDNMMIMYIFISVFHVTTFV